VHVVVNIQDKMADKMQRRFHETARY